MSARCVAGIDGYRMVCDDCGATSPDYSRKCTVTHMVIAHDCNAVCLSCGYAKSGRWLRGLCHGCHQSDIRFDYPARDRFPSDYLLEDYDLLRREGHTVRQAAERLGVTHAALDKALCRAKRKGDPRAKRVAA